MAEKKKPSAADADPHELVALLEEFLLGGPPTLTGPQLAEAVGIPFELARERWRSLGFTSPPEDEVAFTQADLDAMRLTERLRELGFTDEDQESALIRTLGRSYARLADWQMSVLGRAIDLEKVSVEELADTFAELDPVIEGVMRYVWRRHVLNVVSRRLLSATGAAGEESLAVGFADIVNYTRQSRSLGQEELAHLVDEFDGEAQRIITDHNGRVIKTIGDEVLFVADQPSDAALIALELVERHVLNEDFPELRVGLAYGPVLARLGDVFGPTVNVASRLTGTARPGRVLTDRGMAEALEDDPAFRLRRARRTAVKGYRHLEPWALKRPLGEDPTFDNEHLPGPASQFLAERARDLVRAVDEAQQRPERPAGAKPSKKRPSS